MRLCSLVLAACLAFVGCQQDADTAAPMVRPTVTLARGDVALGSPVEMTYRFVVASGAQFNKDYWVFVHFVDVDREIMWTDDHQPDIPTRQWKPGQTIEYTRTMFIPKFPYTGETRVEVGLFSPSDGDRVPMEGTNEGQRSYRLATFNLRNQAESVFVVFKEGWQETEVSSEGLGAEWQWSRKEGVLAFRNPQRDSTFYLLVDQPVMAVGTQRVQVRLAEAVVDSFDLPPGGRQLRKVALTRAQFGSAESTEITVVVEKTFVPAAIPELKSTDARELGVRVFRAYLQ